MDKTDLEIAVEIYERFKDNYPIKTLPIENLGGELQEISYTISGFISVDGYEPKPFLEDCKYWLSVFKQGSVPFSIIFTLYLTSDNKFLLKKEEILIPLTLFTRKVLDIEKYYLFDSTNELAAFLGENSKAANFLIQRYFNTPKSVKNISRFMWSKN